MKFVGRGVVAILGLGVLTLAQAGTVGYTAWDVSGSDKLLKIDLESGVGTVIGGGMGFSDVDGLAFSASGLLYGVDDDTNKLLSIDITTGVATAVGSLQTPGSTSFNDMGLAFIGNTLYMSSTTSSGVGSLFTVNTSTGAASLVGNFGGSLKVRSLGAYGGVLYGWSNVDTLVTLNTTTGAATTKGSFGLHPVTIGQDGMDVDPATGTIWSIAEVEGRTYTLDALTGAATIRATTLTCSGVLCKSQGGFNSLAIAGAVPEAHAGAMVLAGLGVAGVVLRRRTRQA
jgi:hypothetical protein